MQAFLAGLGLLLVGATALPLVRSDAWWVRVFDFPRLQILVLLAAVLAGHLVAGDLSTLPGATFAGALALCLAYQGYMMFPYTRLARLQVEPSSGAAPGSSFSVLFANVRMDNRDATRLNRTIREADPDIVLAVEPDEWWREQLQWLRATHPAAVEHPRRNTYGMLLYSRLELREPQVKFLVEDDVPSIHARVRLASGVEFALRCLHPRPPTPPHQDSSSERDVELIAVARELARLGGPAAVLGDLNDVAWSRTNYRFQALSGLLDPRVGRGFFHTFHAKLPFLRFPLDHCFHSRHFRLVALRRLPAFGSDHFPLYLKLSYEPGDSRP